MLDTIKSWLDQFNKSRLFPISIVFVFLFFLLVRQLFTLQIVNGESYSKSGEYRNEKTRELKSTRGNIYDCNGELLAYDESLKAYLPVINEELIKAVLSKVKMRVKAKVITEFILSGYNLISK